MSIAELEKGEYFLTLDEKNHKQVFKKLMNIFYILMNSQKDFTCKKCKMKFVNQERLDRHCMKAHLNKRKFVKPNEYWTDHVGGI